MEVGAVLSMVASQSLRAIRCVIGGVDLADLRAKRIDGLANSTVGVMTVASLTVSLIGETWACPQPASASHSGGAGCCWSAPSPWRC